MLWRFCPCFYMPEQGFFSSKKLYCRRGHLRKPLQTASMCQKLCANKASYNCNKIGAMLLHKLVQIFFPLFLKPEHFVGLFGQKQYCLQISLAQVCSQTF